MPRFRRFLAPAVLSLLAGNLLSGCSQQAPQHAMPPPEVMVSYPIVKPVTSYVEQTGTAQASERVELRARVAGFLLERNFEDGDLVKAGQLLFVIDEEPFKVKLQYARAKESEADANLKKAEQSKAREIAEAQLTLSQSELQLAKVNHERNIGLLGQNALSRQEYDKTEAALRTAEAQVVASRAELEQAQVNFNTNILSAQAALSLAQSEVKTASIDLGYCRISAPLTGLIDRRSFDIGNYVGADSSAILATIVQVEPIYGYAAISEEELLRVKKRYSSSTREQPIPVRMSIGEDHTFPFEGTVDYISPAVQANTGTVQIRGVFKNNGLVLPGMFIRVRIPSEDDPNAMLVSERSLGYDQAGAYVYVVNAANTVERRSVVPGDTFETNRVIKGDVKPDERVVADGLLKVRPGAEVAPKFVGASNSEEKPASTPAATEAVSNR